MSIFENKFKSGETPLNASNFNQILDKIDFIMEELDRKIYSHIFSDEIGKKQNKLNSNSLKTLAQNSVLGSGNINFPNATILDPAKIWEEDTVMNHLFPPVRRVTILGVTTWEDILDKPIYIKAKGIGMAGSYLSINGLERKPITSSTGLLYGWVQPGEIYTAIYDGTSVQISIRL